ncbi:MAG: sodium:proton antiporter [Verrucomicrobia bacterium]|nr:sodium:proton antiporter [Verrucomicrobiota bacterium]
MTPFDLAALLISLAAIFSYINYRFIKLPTTIGVMLVALLTSVGIVCVGQVHQGTADTARTIIGGIHFDTTLMEGLLSYLLFAGALHVDINRLSRQGSAIAACATVGVVLSTFLVGTLAFYLLPVLGFTPSYTVCLLFGALISPTDPIAVLALLKSANVPPDLQTKIEGESLFNDGIGIVVFLSILHVHTGTHAPSVSTIGLLFLQEAVGGALFGLLIGWATYQLLKSIDQYQVEILLSLAMVTGGYAVAQQLHISGPIAIVVAGLMIGNRGRRLAMSETTRVHLDQFWELIDEVLNAVLFVAIGLELLAVTLSPRHLLAGLMIIPAVLVSRFISVGIPITALRTVRSFTPHVVKILTWAGLRGGISIAMALSLPAGPHRQLLLTMTYIVVLFSILVQGLTVKRMVMYTLGGSPDTVAHRH